MINENCEKSGENNEMTNVSQLIDNETREMKSGSYCKTNECRRKLNESCRENAGVRKSRQKNLRM